MDPLVELVGQSPAIEALRDQIRRVVVRHETGRRLPSVQESLAGQAISAYLARSGAPTPPRPARTRRNHGARASVPLPTRPRQPALHPAARPLPTPPRRRRFSRGPRAIAMGMLAFALLAVGAIECPDWRRPGRPHPGRPGRGRRAV
jgi:hypothetical protein